MASAIWCSSLASLAGTGRAGRRRPQSAVAGRIGDDADERPGDALGGDDRVLRRLVAGHRRTVDQRPPVGMGHAPPAHGAARRHPPDEWSAAGVPVGGPFGLSAELVVRLDDQRGQEFVPAGKVRYTPEDTIPAERATERSDSAAGPTSASWRRASATSSAVIACRARRATPSIAM